MGRLWWGRGRGCGGGGGIAGERGALRVVLFVCLQAVETQWDGDPVDAG